MKNLNLVQIRESVVRGDRTSALNALRSAIDEQEIVPRDGIELMLAVRRGSQEMVTEAVEAMKWGVPGAYRYVPKADYAFA